MMKARAVCGYLWAAPNTLLGLGLALPMLALGGHGRRVDGVLECHGGVLGRALSALPWTSRFGAMTLGHVIVGADARQLALLRPHEHVHVRQYERWGPFFLPAYAASSLWQWLCGRRPYLDNRFERQACRACGERR